jgi:hypothetical protein
MIVNNPSIINRHAFVLPRKQRLARGGEEEGGGGGRTFGQRSRFAFAWSSRCVRDCSGALFSEATRACSCACLAWRSEIVGVK